MPFFPPIAIDGEIYDLSHLDPLTLKVDSAMAAKALTVGVRFSNHCFTKGYEPEQHPLGQPILLDEGRRQRSFCPTRYGLSLQLGQLINDLNHPKVQVAQTAERRNWVYSITMASPQGPYHVFFALKRGSANSHSHSRQDLSLIVESAYPEGELRGGPSVLGRMGFALLCGKVYTGKPLTTKR